ncbi:PD-(D/E)XK nuclease family protein [Streptomyces mirabilis]|uniref:PD-(D/E)XK nuclease family protein n=1 Tax=Streptomyces mirabilis TaxID=68239 RepID=UPI0022535E8A|nr:PD-(D/E)XK nuclease family protein [Streptomyces mirabilis]MCX4612114.1 PD-(D/E)XK nuclease family protein [Streptomyces mirabilis]
MTDDAVGLAELVEAMEADLVFTMSLGSKELFHSNLLGWFIAHHPAVAEAMTGSAGPVQVEREKQNTDLLIRSDGRPPMVIENKVFALPDSSQLDRIAKKFDGQDPRLVLLSLTPPTWGEQAWTSPGGYEWTWLSYEQLEQLLRPTVAKVAAADEYAGATLARWLDLMGRLGDLTRLVGQPTLDEPLQLPRNERDILHTARLDVPVQKMRFQRVASELGNRGLTGVGTNLTNGTALIEWYTDSPRGFRWGWQLQGEQFRLAIVVEKGHPGHGSSAKHKGIRQEEARRHSDFFEFGSIKGAGPVGPVRNIEFCDYNPDFIYKYVPIPGITVGQAVDLGIEYVQRIEQLGSIS